ncbi:hypothetical protein EV426DRAFT_358444 [Tirmania nivea]|nr:hypothetical protein EV426DRAFT_358444 [Tirmania nivea]
MTLQMVIPKLLLTAGLCADSVGIKGELGGETVGEVTLESAYRLDRIYHPSLGCGSPPGSGSNGYSAIFDCFEPNVRANGLKFGEYIVYV